MNISKITLEKAPRSLQNGDVVAGHQFVMSLFPSDVGDSPRNQLNILWRREVNRQGMIHYLVQSDQAPDLENIRSSLKDRIRVETRDVEDHYRDLLSRESFSYKIRVNPVVSQGHKRFPVKGEKDIADWWVSRLHRMNVRIVDNALIVDPEPLVKSMRNSQPLIINSATIIGRARVENPDTFLSVVKEGIGKARSYGYGLVLIGG